MHEVRREARAQGRLDVLGRGRRDDVGDGRRRAGAQPAARGLGGLEVVELEVGVDHRRREHRGRDRGRVRRAQPLPRRALEQPGGGPAPVLHLPDQARDQPAGGTPRVLGHHVDEGVLGPLERAEHAVELAPRRRGDPGEHAARVAQPRLARHPDQQRPDRVRPPARRDPAADHDVLDTTHGRLDPAPRAPADLVGGLEALGDHAVEAVAPRRGDHRLGAHAGEVRGDDDAAAGEVELGEQLAALAVGQPARRHAGHLQHVEHVVGDRHARLQDLRRVGDAGPAAQLAGAGAAHPVEGDDDPVEHEPAGARPGRRDPELREVRRDVAPGVGDQPQPLVTGAREAAQPVPEELERPARAARDVARAREHGAPGRGLGVVGGRRDAELPGRESRHPCHRRHLPDPLATAGGVIAGRVHGIRAPRRWHRRRGRGARGLRPGNGEQRRTVERRVAGGRAALRPPPARPRRPSTAARARGPWVRPRPPTRAAPGPRVRTAGPSRPGGASRRRRGP